MRSAVFRFRFRVTVLLLAAVVTNSVAMGADLPVPISPWKIELVAQSPELRHPSVVATAPDGRVFVAEDPMDITAPADATLGRILCLHPDGRQTVFATNLHAVFGLQYLEGKVYVLHNPRFSVFRDRNGAGTDREDLIHQTNPNPWALDWNDHVPANFRLGMDGFFYVAIGDKGLYGCTGRDGSRIDLHGGGILRLRPDGTALEVFSTGVRNILDVALNAEDEIFTYDNTDEHHWMGRLTHMVDGGFYGYPHDFIPQRPYTLWMMHDFGAGAACGAVACTSDALPEEFHGNLFLSDFGKRQVTRVRIEREGATFKVSSHEPLFREIPEDFRPVGIAFSDDGLSLYVCDWQHRDVKAQAEVGRLWRLTWTGPSRATPRPAWYQGVAQRETPIPSAQELVDALGHPSREVRMTAQRALIEKVHAGKDGTAADTAKLSGSLSELLLTGNASPMARSHALWVLDALPDERRIRETVHSLLTNPTTSAEVLRQALRQTALRRNAAAIAPLIALLKNPDGSIRLGAATALGRIGDARAVKPLQLAGGDSDLFVRYGAFTALNRIGRATPAAWPEIISGLRSEEPRVADSVRFALRDTFMDSLVSSLISFLNESSTETVAREGALRCLADLRHQPPEWRGEWWAYHPAKAPAPERTVAWSSTQRILGALRAALSAPEPSLRVAAAQGLTRARDTNSLPKLRFLYANDTTEAVRTAALQCLAQARDADAAPLLASALHSSTTPVQVLNETIRFAPRIPGAEVLDAMLECANRRDLTPATRRLAVDALAEIGNPKAAPVLEALLERADGELTLSILDALGRIGGSHALNCLQRALHFSDLQQRLAAIRALGKLKEPSTVPNLLESWRNPQTRDEALAALTRFSDARGLEAYLAGLESIDPSVREQCRKALTPIRSAVLADIESRASTLPAIVLAELRQVYAPDPDVLGRPFLENASHPLDSAEYETHALNHAGNAERGERLFFDERGVACSRCHRVEDRGGSVGPDLSLAGIQFTRAQLIESILYPSRAIREGYQQVIVETRDGESLAGAIKADTADGVTLVDATGRTNFVSRAMISNRDTSSLSLMPEGLQAGLSPDDFSDLIAYLESRRAADLRGGAPALR